MNVCYFSYVSFGLYISSFKYTVPINSENNEKCVIKQNKTRKVPNYTINPE